MEKLKVALVGIGHPHADAVLDELVTNKKDLFEVVGYYESDENIVNQKKDTLLYKNLPLLDMKSLIGGEYDLDGVLIESGMAKLLDYGEQCLDLKVPIHIDKPAGMDFSRFKQFMLNAKSSGIPVQMGYMYRYNPAVCKCRDMLKTDEIGEVYAVEAQMSTELPEDLRKTLGQYAGGSMYLYGCHLIDLVMQFQGVPQAIHTFLKKTQFDNIDVHDCTMAVLEYEKGTSFVRSSAVEANGYGRRQLVITGSKGTVVVCPLENVVTMTYAQRDGANIYTPKEKKIDLGDLVNKRRFDDMMTDFANIIQKQTDNLIFPIDYDYEISVHRAILQSSGETI